MAKRVVKVPPHTLWMDEYATAILLQSGGGSQAVVVVEDGSEALIALPFLPQCDAVTAAFSAIGSSGINAACQTVDVSPPYGNGPRLKILSSGFTAPSAC